MITRDIGEFIVRMEGRRDSEGNLAIYKLPKEDGGGEFEIAGINNKYHPEEANKLKSLILEGNYKEAEEAAIDYIIKYTSVHDEWHPDERVQVFLRDCRFNRGPTGAAKIFQQALIIPKSYTGPLDGLVGKNTKRGAKKHTADDLLPRLLLARQWYEREIVGRDESSRFWGGLTNRWINVFQVSLSIGNPYSDFQSIIINTKDEV